MHDCIFFNKTSMLFMFEWSTILIISRIVIETITKTTKIVIEVIEKRFALNENDNNWKSIFNNVTLSIEAKTIETTINDLITNRWDFNSDWDFDSDWDSNSNTNARDFLDIDKSRNECQTHKDLIVYLVINKRKSKKWERRMKMWKLIYSQSLNLVYQF